MKKGSHLTEENKKKISEALKNYYSSNVGKDRIVQIREECKYRKCEKHPFFGKHHTQETKNKISEAKKGKHYPKMSEAQKGKKHTKEHNSKISESLKGNKNPFYGKKHTEETKQKIREARLKMNFGDMYKGKNNPQWKGGVTPITVQIKNSIKYRRWRQDIFIRDDFTCLKCGTKGGNLNVHHIKSFSDFIEEIKNLLPLFSLYEGAMIYSPMWDKGNGITLCKKCHYKLHCKNNKEE